jgi:hypothetical protein
MRRLGVFVCPLLVLLLAACSSSSGGAAGPTCRTTGSDNGVSIYFEPGTLPSAGDVAITACVNGECRAHVAKATEPNIFVPVLPTPPDADVEVRVKVLSGKAEVLFDDTTSTRSIKVVLHEHGCSSSAARVSVIAHRDGSLTPTP